MADGTTTTPETAGRHAERSFMQMTPEERKRLINEADKRRVKYRDLFLPVRGMPPKPPITSEAVQRALLLESYYSLAHETLDGQHRTTIVYPNGKVADQQTIRERQERAAAENERLQAVQTQGDWRRLKEKWHHLIDDQDPLTRKYWDVDKARKILSIVPDKTDPISAQFVDPDPPLL